MKLLIYTQTIDINNPILGFFHRWVEEFARQYDEVHIICLRKGEYNLPKNVFVYSLGKENGENRFKYIFLFFVYLWRLRNKHQAVFVHMNPHYVVLGGWFWKLRKIPIFFWRNHARMDIKTRIAAFFAKNVFFTSPFACTSIFKNSVQMPVGIDIDVFCPSSNIRKEENSVLFLGRLSKVKRPELFITTASHLNKYNFHIYGNDQSGAKEYEISLKKIAGPNVAFHNSVVNNKTPEIYNAFELYCNFTPEGSMDKTILEAAACGTLILVTNKSFEGKIPDECLIHEDIPEGIERSIQYLLNLPVEKKMEYASTLREMVVREHSLKKLIEEFVKYVRV